MFKEWIPIGDLVSDFTLTFEDELENPISFPEYFCFSF